MQRFLLVLIAALAIAGPTIAIDRYDKLSFDKKTHKATASDILAGGDTLYYSLKGTKGTGLSINFSSNSATCAFNLYEPGMPAPIFQGASGNGAYSGTLTEDGEYRIRVRMKGKPSKICNFTLYVRAKAKKS